MKNYAVNITAFTGRYFFFLSLLVLIFCRLVMVVPVFPMNGLDPSWVYGLGAASSGHFAFGRDIIHNFGPLSMIFTGFWTPEFHFLTVVLSIILALSLCFFTYKVFENAGYLVKFLLVLFFFVNVSGIRHDFFYSLLPALGALYLIRSYSFSKSYAVIMLLFGFDSALLMLVKMSFGAEAFLCLLLLLAFYAIKKDWKCCIVLLAGFLVFFAVLFVLAGQKISDIIYYPLNVYYGSTGYTDALSWTEPASANRPVVSAAVFYIVFLSYLAWRALKPFDLQKFFTLGVFGLLTLVVFKHSFIRNAYGHGITADSYLYHCFLLIYFLHCLGKSAARNILITLCVVSLLVLGSENFGYFFKGPRVNSSYSSLITNAANIGRLFDESKNIIDYQNSVRKISNAWPFPSLEGTSDIYNFNQARLLASENKWNPRPRFQSYQAVNEYTIKGNYEHLLNKERAPDNVFFRVETIDRRIPTLDDGLSWKALLGVYKPAGWTQKKDYLILKRDSSGEALSVKDSKEISAWTGQEIDNPFEHGLVFFSLHMSKSLPGKLLTVVYKTDPVWMKIKLQNGQEKNFRIIPSMSGTGFLLSPLILNTVDFAGLYKAGYFPDGDIGMRVKSLTILPESPYQYSDSIDVTFEQLELPDRSKALVQKLGSRKSLDLKSVRSDPSVKFNVDSFSYRFTDDRRLLLGVRGWSFRKNVNIKNSSYSLIFAGQDGNCFEIPLSNAKRDDVTKYFKDGHNYDMSGFQTYDLFIDASELKGKTEYKVYLEMTINGASQIVQLGKTMNVS